ncbi:helix-turn-helix domain-containing protein, partial [Kitasatospora sp. NPDC096147]|uniref:helix-turn-helix domain-containing protein n=1 Tax=Kitasatospora sp. NPDC096147 TaxID=3364093 RepID=UPI0038269B76
ARRYCASSSSDDAASPRRPTGKPSAGSDGASPGTTPHARLLELRLSRAEELLETTTLPVEEVARLVGYRSAAVLREQFVRRRGVPPTAYRQAFGRI